MRILYFIHQFFPVSTGGTENFALRLAQSMQRSGHQVAVLTYGQGTGRFKETRDFFVHSYFYQGIPVVALEHKKIPWDLSWGMSAENPLRLFVHRFLKKHGYDLIHFAHLMRISPFAASPSTLKIPYIFTLTDYFSICYQNTLRTLDGIGCFGPNRGKTCAAACPGPGFSASYFSKRLKTANKIMSRAFALTAPSSFLASRIQREFPSLGIKIIPHGTPHRPAIAPQKVYSRQSRVAFGYSGAIHPIKGIHTLIHAFQQIRATNCSLKIYGDLSKEPLYASRLIKAAAEDKRIAFCEPYSSNAGLAAALKQIDVLCLPSEWFETYSLAAEEAFSEKIPVIASGLGALADRVKPGINGFTFKSGDSWELYRIMQKIIADPKILNALRRNISDYTTAEEEAVQYENLYRQALA